MTIKAVFFDFGGVIMRTEYQSPRQQLAERFHMDYEEIDRLVFNSESARRASVGEITEEEHWQGIMKRFKLPPSEVRAFSDSFFGGDVIDRSLVEFIRSLQGKFHTGLISNAWGGMREFLTRERILDAFDTIIISAEARMMKPDAGIFELALSQAGVKASESVFVDDLMTNIEACQQTGMKGILFRDPQEALKELKQLLNLN
jgi:epoxide hydrolase-like predicted phosphatase